jgi:hypothetical protein
MGGGFMLLLQAIAFGFIAALPILTFTIYNRNFRQAHRRKSEKVFQPHFSYKFFIDRFFIWISLQRLPGCNSSIKIIGFRIGDLPGLFHSIHYILLRTYFHFSILYGLYWLRREINNNTSSKQFDFEEENV